MNPLRLLYFMVMITVLIPYLAKTNPVSVPSNHPIYEYLERMEGLGIVYRILDGVKPFSRDKIARILLTIFEKKEQLTKIDQQNLQRFLLEFRYEITPEKKYHLTPEGQNWYSILSSWPNFKKDFKRFFKERDIVEENHVAIWEKSKDAFYFDYEQGITFDNRSDNLNRSATWQNYKFRGVLNQNFGYAVSVSLQGIRGDEGYREFDPILKQSFTQVNATDENMLFADRTGGELAWHSHYFDFTFAQQELEWGPGESGKLLLSNYPEQYPYISISREWNWGKFTALHGKLQSFLIDSIITDGTRYSPDKWVAAHRLEIAPLKNLTLGFNESFIYGYRYADWAYLIPFNFYRAVQHKLRDRDNATISVDCEWIPFSRTKLYGTIYLDEFKKSKLGTDWFGNKHGFQFGFIHLDPFRISNLKLCFEYVAIMPWVYTHKFDINRYESDGRSLGYWAGPNSEVYFLNLKKDWNYRFYTGLRFRLWKHGANYSNENIGGDLLLGRGALIGSQQEPRETRQFLEGILTREQRVEFYSEYKIFNGLFINGNIAWQNTDTEDIEKKFNETHLGFRLEY